MRLPNPRQTYKAELMDYEWLLSLNGGGCMYCLSQREVQLILSMVDYIGWQSRYLATTDGVDKEVIEGWKAGLVEKLMNDCCDDKPIASRYTEDGVLQYQYEEGGEWFDAPNDPRNTSPTFPPLEGEDGTDKKCAAANSIKIVLDEDIIQKMEETAGAIAILELIAVVLGIFLSGGTLAPLLMALVGQILGVGVAATKAAFTTEVWDAFICVVFCNMSDDASFTDEQFEQIRADLLTGSEFNSIAGSFLRNTVTAWGRVGLTNAARSGRSDETDCSSCGCIDECAAASQSPYFTFGTVLSVTGDTVRVRAELYAGSFYLVAWGDYGVVGDKCCQWQAVNVVSGGSWASSQTEYTDCGGTVHANLDPTHVDVTHVSLYPTGQVIFDIQFPS